MWRELNQYDSTLRAGTTIWCTHASSYCSRLMCVYKNLGFLRGATGEGLTKLMTSTALIMPVIGDTGALAAPRPLIARGVRGALQHS